MQLRDVLSPSLASEPRLQTGAPVLRRVYESDLHEVHLALYPSGLVTALVHYKREGLRVMTRGPALSDAPHQGNASEARIQEAVSALQSQGRGPLQLVLDAKLEAGLSLSLHDRAALKLAGIVVPREAGRFKDLFPEGG